MTNFYKFFTDTETTGFSQTEDQIISYSVVIEDSKAQNIEEYEKMVKLKSNILATPKALIINNINPFSPEFLKIAGKERDLMNDLIRISNFGRVMLCAYNAEFDEGMYAALFKRLGKSFAKYFTMIWDPLPTAKKLIEKGHLVTPEIVMGKKSYRTSKLEEVFKALGHDSSKFNAHSALDDTKMLQMVAHGVFYLATNRLLIDINPDPASYKVDDKLSIIFIHEEQGVIPKHIKVIQNDYHKRMLQVCLMDGSTEVIPYELIMDQFEPTEQISKVLDGYSASPIELIREKKHVIEFDEAYLQSHLNDSIDEIKLLTEAEYKAVMDYSYSEKDHFVDSDIHGSEYQIRSQEYMVDKFKILANPKGVYDVFVGEELQLSSDKRTLMDKLIKDELEKKYNDEFLIRKEEILSKIRIPGNIYVLYEKFQCSLDQNFIVCDLTKKNKVLLDSPSEEAFEAFIKTIVDEFIMDSIKKQLKKIPSVKDFKIERHPESILTEYNDLKAEVFQTSNKHHKEIMKDLLTHYKKIYPSIFKDVGLPTFQLNLGSFLKK